ncbi:MAG TPA: DeoR/GlpR family DNA-binding transcription regulator, partial [Candidatus Methylacidiphilales bacterium]
MRVAKHIVDARREQVARLLRQHRYLPLQELCDRLSISEATARRDLAALADAKKVTRTYGGALADYNETFASFAERRNLSRAAKREIAARARALLRPGATCFIDAGTTMLALA